MTLALATAEPVERVPAAPTESVRAEEPTTRSPDWLAAFVAEPEGEAGSVTRFPEPEPAVEVPTHEDLSPPMAFPRAG